MGGANADLCSERGTVPLCDRDGVKEGRDSHFGSVKG